MAQHAVSGNSKDLQRNKIPELELALEGRVTENHRFLPRATLRSWTVLGEKQWTERHIVLAHLAVQSFLSALKTSGKQTGFTMKNKISRLCISACRSATSKACGHAVAPALLAFHMLKRNENDRNLGADHFDHISISRVPVVLGPTARTPGTPSVKITQVSWHVTLIAAFSF
jgi:hypothetical protein